MGGELLILFVSHSIYMYGNNQLTPQLDLCHLLYFSPYLLNISCNCLFAPQSQSIIFTKIKPTKLHHIGPKKTISILLGLNPWLAQRKCIHLTFASIPCHQHCSKNRVSGCHYACFLRCFFVVVQNGTFHVGLFKSLLY